MVEFAEDATQKVSRLLHLELAMLGLALVNAGVRANSTVAPIAHFARLPVTLDIASRFAEPIRRLPTK